MAEVGIMRKLVGWMSSKVSPVPICVKSDY